MYDEYGLYSSSRASSIEIDIIFWNLFSPCIIVWINSLSITNIVRMTMVEIRHHKLYDKKTNVAWGYEIDVLSGKKRKGTKYQN